MSSFTTKLLLVAILVSSFFYAYNQNISININWNEAIRSIPTYAYGVNSPANFIPEYSENEVFMDNLAFITQKKGIVRLHGWGMITEGAESWQTAGIWDSIKIHQALLPLMDAGYEVMINIPSGPGGEEDYQNIEQLADFCAELVRIVNVQYGLGVKYWEIPNELEAGFSDPGLSVAQMSNFIQTAAQAMKAHDPSIKVGGSATAWVNVDYLSALASHILDDIDFISCHTYGGDGHNDIQEAYDIAQYAIMDLGLLRSALNEISGNKYLPIFLTEYNVAYQGAERIQNYQGAIYDAIILTQSIKVGADASCYWNVAPYTDMSMLDGDEHFEYAHLYEVMNQSFHGQLVDCQSSDSTQLIVYASQTADANSRSICLINRTAQSLKVNLNMDESMPNHIQYHQWSEEYEYLQDSLVWTESTVQTLNLAPYSIHAYVAQRQTTHTDNITNATTAIYPNPSNDYIHLATHLNLSQIKILDSKGQLVYSAENKWTSPLNINIKAWPSGLYHIHTKAKGDQHWQLHTFIKQ